MPCLFINQQTETSINDDSLPTIDIYADAILHTFGSLKPSLTNDSLNTSTSSLFSSSLPINRNQVISEKHIPLIKKKNKQLKKFQRLLSRFDRIYNKKKMSTKTLLPSSSSSQITDRYFFRSHSNDTNNTRKPSKKKLNNISSSQSKRYKFSSTNTEEQYNSIYKFSTNPNDQRSRSSDSNRYYFRSDNSIKYPQQRLAYIRSGSGSEQHSVTFIDGSSTFITDTPYLFSKTTTTTASQRYPNTLSTFVPSEDTLTYQRQQPSHRVLDNVMDSSMRASSTSPDYRQSTRMDTVTSTNGSLSVINRSTTDKSASVHFESSSLSATARSHLNETRERLSGKISTQSLESFEKSVDRLVSSVNKKYGQQQQMISPSTSSSLNYLSQYYAKVDEPSIDYTLDSDDEHQRLYYNLNTNRTHTQIMKTVNKSLIDRNYQLDKNRVKQLEQNVRRYIRLFENQALERELNYNLIRCFSSSYLQDIKKEEIRQKQIRSHTRSYTYEDIQDIHVPSILEAYKMKIAIDREKQISITPGQLSPGSSSGYSPIMIRSLNENLDGHSGGFETDRKSYTSISQTYPNVDLFYEIMQDSFRGVDASIAGHVSKASQFTKSKSYKTIRETDSDVDIKSSSSFWSDEDQIDHHIEGINKRKKLIPHQRKISRYLSAVNRSLLDYPSDLIADFYLSQLNLNMQESIRHIENISRDKAYQQEFLDQRQNRLGRSLSAEHLYQVRKEHLRYKQSFKIPTSFTAEDVADIYKRFVLENYKRKIAIELERRRRQRLLISNIHNSEIDSNQNIIKSRTRNDFMIVSPPIIVQTKGIIMGRARRTLNKDGSEDIIHHISSLSPPPVYSINEQASQTQIQFIATINEQYENSHVSNIDPPDFVDRNREEEIIDRTSKQDITISRRPQTKIYTNIPQTNEIQLCRANRIESESNNHNLSMINIDSIVRLNQYEVNSLTDQTHNEQITEYHEQEPKQEQSILIIPIDEHNATIQEYIPIIELLQTTNLSIPSINKANEISGDSGISLNISQINEQPTILNSSFPNQLEPWNDPYSQTTKDHNEPLPEYEKTTIRNEIPYVDPLNEPITLASLLEELTIAIHKQHATQIIDDGYYWKTCEKVEESTRVPIIVYDTEWKDEKVEMISNEFQPSIENAVYKYPENIEYEQVKINLPQQFQNTFEIQQITDNDEQITSLSEDSYLIQHQQQSNIHIDEFPYLEKPLQSTGILTLNYPQHNQRNNEQTFSTISSNHIDSQKSSFADMETLLNHFEESLNHEQHLPLIDQISLSYATSIIERNQQKHRSLPFEWFQPTILSHDEQLVEQWIIENNINIIQQEGTLHRQQVEFITNTECENLVLATSIDAFCTKEKSNNSTLRENYDIISHCSLTSDYETDSVEKDNDTVIIPLTILPSSSITNTTFVSQSSPLLTSYTAPIAPIVYFLDVLALEENERKNSTKDFLLTIGFGQTKMNELTNTVSTVDQPLRATWINRSSDNIEILPTSIHHENEHLLSSKQQQIHFPIENRIEEDDTALLIYPHHLQYGYNLGENTQGPLTTFFEPAHLHLPMINEVYLYQMSFHNDFPFFYPPDTLPHMLTYQIQDDEILLPDRYQLNQPEILSFSQIHDLLDIEKDTQLISFKLDQPAYIEHYHIQSLFPFPETCYAEINQPTIITNNNNFLSNFILTKPNKNEDDDILNRFMRQNSGYNQTEHKDPGLNFFPSTSSVPVRPSIPTDSGPIYEDVSIKKDVDVNMGTNGQYNQQAKYIYGNEQDITQKYSTIERMHDPKQANLVSNNYNKQDVNIFASERMNESITEDDKSTSSEEVIFEEWTEEFRCRRTDEFDRHTNKLLRTTIDETSDRIKGDVIKEEYKGKNTRLKGHKKYDIGKEVYRRVPNHIYEEIPQPPPPPVTSSQDRHWTSEQVYTTEIVHDVNLANELETTAKTFASLTNYDRVHPNQYTPIPSTSRYDRISNVVTPTLHYADKRNKEPEEVVSEEYHIELQTPTKREDLTDTYEITDQQSPTRRSSEWRNKLKEIYHPPSDDDQHKNRINGNYVAQRVSVIPSSPSQRIKEVQVKIAGHNKTPPPPEQRKFETSPPSRHTVKEVLVCISRGSSPEKQYHHSSIDENEQRKKRLFLVDPETSKKVISTSPTSSRVGELKNVFETTTSGSIRDDTSKYKTSITTGLAEQRRRIFEEQDKEWTQRPINEFHSNERRMSETHTAPSLVSDRISSINNLESRIQSNDRLNRREYDVMKSTSPQTSIDITYRNKQIISSMDSDLSGPTQPIYQSTPKSIKQKYDDDGHESEDELSDPKQNYDTRRRTSKTRLRDFSQSTSQPIDTTSKFNETNMEDILSHVPTSKGKGILIELSPRKSQSPTKSNLISDSGVFEYSTATSHQLPSNSVSWRHNVSTSIADDTTRSRDYAIHIDSTTSPYTRRQISDADQTTIQNADDSLSRSTYKYEQEIFPKQQPQQQQRIVRRQITNSPPIDYENPTNYHSRIDTQSRVPITTQSRSIKPLMVNEVETIETETRIECQVQRTNETNESTKTERIPSPMSPSKRILTTTASRLYNETTPAKRVLLNDRPHYYEPNRAEEETEFQPIERDYSQDNLRFNPSSPPRSYSTGPHTMQVTSLSPPNQITFGRRTPNEIVAVVRVPELTQGRIRHGISESNLYEKPRQEEERPRLHYQRVNATSYRPPLLPQNYQQRSSRLRHGPSETTNDYSSPINFPVRSASYHPTLHEQNQPSHSQNRYQHSSSLGNLFGSNLEFEIQIEKRPPSQPEQPTSISLDQSSRAIVTTSKDGRVSIQNVAAYPGNTVVINSDFHSSDRSLNRSSGYFSSDEPRSQGHTTNYSSDEQSIGANQNSLSTSSPARHYQINHHFDQVNEIVHHYSQPSSNRSIGFNETIDQIDALYNNLDIQKTDQQPYDFSKLNRRKQLTQNPNEYSKRYTSTGFQQIPYEQQTTTDFDNNQNQNWTSSSLTNLVMSTPIRPSSSSGVLADYGTSNSINSTQNMIIHQNRLNGQSQLVQRNRTSVKQMKQKNAAKKRNGNIQGQYSDEDDDNESPLSDNGRPQPSSRVYNFNNYHHQ